MEAHFSFDDIVTTSLLLRNEGKKIEKLCPEYTVSTLK